MHRVVTVALLSVLTSAFPIATSAQIKELPNVPIVCRGWQEKFWTHPDGTKFHYSEWGSGVPVILINRGHLSSYMAGLCPEVYRDALTNFIVRNNPE